MNHLQSMTIPKFSFLKKIRHLRDLFIILVISLTFILFSIFSFKIPYGIEGDEFSWTITSVLRKYDTHASDVGLWSMHDSMYDAFPVSAWMNQLGFLLFSFNIITPRIIGTGGQILTF